MSSQTRTAFVSGAGQNIGRSIALCLAQGGADVIINGLKNRQACEETAAQCRALGRQAMVLMGDVGQRDEIRKMADAALAQFGTVDIVVNNAAIRPIKPFLESSEEEWSHVIQTNLYSAFYACRAFLPGMVAAGWGRIVNFAGMNAIHGYGDGGSANSAAKHALWGLSKSLAKEFGPKGVTVNIVSPGPIRREGGPGGSHAPVASGKGIPVGRPGEPKDIGALVAFLCSADAGFITGQMIGVNGGIQT